MFGPKCKRCDRSVFECDVCKGTGRYTDWFSSGRCTECDGTGYLCPEHDKYWR